MVEVKPETQESIYLPPLTSLTQPVIKGEEVMGIQPDPKMAEPTPLSPLMTDITMEEMKAGKQASDQYARRRKAEMDYGKNFSARRLTKIIGG